MFIYCFYYILFFWYFSYTQPDNDSKSVCYIGGLAGHIMSNDSRSTSSLRSGKQFLSRAPYQPTPGTPATSAAQQQQAANVIPIPNTAAAQATFFGSTGSAQVMAISLSNTFPGFSDARLMNEWLDAVNVLATSQGQQPQKHILSHIPFGALPNIKAMGILDKNTWDDMKAEMLKLCMGPAFNDTKAAKRRWEALKMTDYDHIADFQFTFLSLAKQCGADDEAQFHQYKKAMSEEFREAMEHAMKIPKSLAEIKEQAAIFGQLQTERRERQAKLELEMQEATSSMTAAMDHVQVDDDEEEEMAIAASYNQGQKRQWKKAPIQQGSKSKFVKRRPAENGARCWRCGESGHLKSSCPEEEVLPFKPKPKPKSNSVRTSYQENYVQTQVNSALSSVTIGTPQVRLTNDMASTYGSELFHGLTRTKINMKSHITLVDTGAARLAIALEAYDQGTHGPICKRE